MICLFFCYEPVGTSLYVLRENGYVRHMDTDWAWLGELSLMASVNEYLITEQQIYLDPNKV